MAITVNGPNGVTINFPDGTDSDTINRVMKEAVGGSGGSMPPPPAAKPSVSAGEFATDLAKSTGIGLAQGAIGLATLPGNVEALGRMGIDAGARALGINDPKLSEGQILPSYSGVKSSIEGVTGPFYEPKTTAGEYARTIGEFAPNAIGGAGLASKAARVLGPAIGSETAGQMTEGTAYEPWARAGGALAGTRLPGASMRAVTPNPVSPERAKQVALLEKEGVSLTAGQKTGNKPLRWAESVAVDTPFSGKKAGKMLESQKEQYTAAVLRKAGVNANRATPDVLDDAFKKIGLEYENFSQHHAIRPFNRYARNLVRRVQNVANDFEDITPASARPEIVRKLANDISTRVSTAGLPGKVYHTYRSQIEKMRRSAQSNPPLAHALGKMRDSLDETYVLSAPGGRQNVLRKTFKDLNRRYKNLLVVEKAAGGAGEDAALGLLSPSAVRNAAKVQGRRQYTRGKTDMAPLARAGEAIMKPLPNSGTAPRESIMDMAKLGGAIVGTGMGGPVGGVLGALSPMAGKAALGRVAMSRPMQAYMSNQKMAPAMAAQGDVSMWSPMAQALMQIEQEQGLRGGIGPRYNENGNLRK